MKHSAIMALGLAALTLLAGCGGSGVTASSGGTTPAARERVQDVLSQGAMARQMSAGPAAMRSLEPGDGSGVGEVTFNESLQLWQVLASVEPIYRVNLFEDQALTKPAGFSEVNSNFDWEGQPAYRAEVQVDAGPYDGYRSLFLIATSHEVGAVQRFLLIEATWPGQGSIKIVGENLPEGSRYTTTWIRNGLTQTFVDFYSNDPAAEFPGIQTMQASDGTAYELKFRQDGSGVGRIQGAMAGLPADVVWNAAGDVTITFADGSTLETTWHELIQRLQGLVGL